MLSQQKNFFILEKQVENYKMCQEIITYGLRRKSVGYKAKKGYKI